MIKEDLSISGNQNKSRAFSYYFNDSMYITIDKFIEFNYSLELNKLTVRSVHNTDTSEEIYIDQLLSDNDLDFLNTIKENLKTFDLMEYDKEEYHPSIHLVFNNGILDILLYKEYNPRIMLENIYNGIWHVIVTCKNETDVLEIKRGLELLYEKIKEPLSLSLKEKQEKLTSYINYGFKVNDKFTLDNSQDHLINSNSIPFRINVNLENLFKYKENNEVYKYIKKKYPSIDIDISFPSILIPTVQSPYSKELINTLNNLPDYLLAIDLCKVYKINKVFDIGCRTGVQSWFFNNNEFHYIGIEDCINGLFPFWSNERFFITYSNTGWPKVYRKNNNFGFNRESYTDSLVLLFNPGNMMFNQTTGKVNESWIRMLVKHHKYILIKDDSKLLIKALRNSNMLDSLFKESRIRIKGNNFMLLKRI